MSEWLVLAIAMALVCALVLAITTIRHRRVAADEDTSETPDVIEYMVMMVGVVYAIVLGLAIAGVWEARGSAEDSVRREAQSLYEVTQRADVYPAPVRDRIRGEVDAYVSHTVAVDWPLLVSGRAPRPRAHNCSASCAATSPTRAPPTNSRHRPTSRCWTTSRPPTTPGTRGPRATSPRCRAWCGSGCWSAGWSRWG